MKTLGTFRMHIYEYALHSLCIVIEQKWNGSTMQWFPKKKKINLIN